MIHVEIGQVDNWLKEHLICPRDHSDLTLEGNMLTCQKGHTFPFIHGIPVMLLQEVNPTHMTCVWSLEQATDDSQWQEVSVQDVIDPFVQEIVASTCGHLYKPLVNNLKEYPIPELPLIEPVTSGKYFLDIGCNWGRWCISAARKGYYPIGIDPSINGIMAASRVSNQLGIKASYIVGDSRYLPFSFKCFDVVFSFSVLHHFDKNNTKKTLKEISRTLKTNSLCIIQLSNTLGLRNLFNQFKSWFKAEGMFDLRYWMPSELKNVFEELIGPTVLVPHAFLSTGALMCDIKFLPLKYRLLVRTSEMLRKMSERIDSMKMFADSFYVKSIAR